MVVLRDEIVMARYGVCSQCQEAFSENSVNHIRHLQESPMHLIEWEDLTKKSVSERLNDLEKRVTELEGRLPVP